MAPWYRKEGVHGVRPVWGPKGNGAGDLNVKRVKAAGALQAG